MIHINGSYIAKSYRTEIKNDQSQLIEKLNPKSLVQREQPVIIPIYDSTNTA